MNDYRPIEIDEAKALAEAHGLEQLVLWSYRTGPGQHVTTWGEPFEHSSMAADAGNRVKYAAGWPRELCTALPTSIGVLFFALDMALASEIRAGKFDKATVLGSLLLLRDLVRERDPVLSEKLIPRFSEAAQPGIVLDIEPASPEDRWESIRVTPPEESGQ